MRGEASRAESMDVLSEYIPSKRDDNRASAEPAAPGLEDRCLFGRTRAEGQSVIPGLSRRRPRVRVPSTSSTNLKSLGNPRTRIRPNPSEPIVFRVADRVAEREPARFAPGWQHFYLMTGGLRRSQGMA